jgi:hypothetical protein
MTTYSVAQIIQAEAPTSSPAGQFAVAATIYNRMQAGGFGGSDAVSVANAPGQFAGHLISPSGPGNVPSTTSSYAAQLGAALEAGQPPPGGSTGNSLYFMSGSSSISRGGGVNIGGNYFSDNLGAPSSNHVAPSYGGDGTVNTGPASAGGFGSSLTMDPNSPNYGDITNLPVAGVNAPAGGSGAGVGNDQGTPNLGGGVSQTSTGQAQGTPIKVGLQPEEVSAIQGWVNSFETSVGTAFAGALKSAQTATGTLFGGIQNWFIRAFLIILGIILLAVGLVALMWDHGGKETAQTAMRVVAA